MAFLNSTALWMEVVVTEVHTRTLWLNATESWSLRAPVPTTEVLVTPGVDLDGVLVWPDLEPEPIATATETTLPEAAAETPTQILAETPVETPADTLSAAADPPFPTESFTLDTASKTLAPALVPVLLSPELLSPALLSPALALAPPAPSLALPRAALTTPPLQNSMPISIESTLMTTVSSLSERTPSSLSRSSSRSLSLSRSSYPRPRKHAVTAPVRVTTTPSPRPTTTPSPRSSLVIPKFTKRFNGVVRANWSPLQYTGGSATPRVGAALALAALCAGALLLA